MKQYNVRAQMRRSKSTKIPIAIRNEIFERDEYTCVYCGFAATALDHVVPFSYGGSDEPDNLVACCSICNTLLSNRIFPSVAAKRSFLRARYGPYLVERVRRYRSRLSICADCGHVFSPAVPDATNILCATCNIDDQTWEPTDERRVAKRLQRDRFTALTKAALIATGLRIQAADPAANN